MSKLTIIKAFWRHCINGAVAAFIAIACFLFESSRVLLEETDISLEELEAEAENPMGGARALGGVCLLTLSSPEEGGFKSNRSMENDDLRPAAVYMENETWTTRVGTGLSLCRRTLLEKIRSHVRR